MQKALQKIFWLFTKTNPPRKTSARKPWGQSLVEVAITFPILIMLFTGVVEFGFILNTYLSLVDATRDAYRARFGAFRAEVARALRADGVQVHEVLDDDLPDVLIRRIVRIPGADGSR